MSLFLLEALLDRPYHQEAGRNIDVTCILIRMSFVNPATVAVIIAIAILLVLALTPLAVQKVQDTGRNQDLETIRYQHSEFHKLEHWSLGICISGILLLGKQLFEWENSQNSPQEALALPLAVGVYGTMLLMELNYRGREARARIRGSLYLDPRGGLGWVFALTPVVLGCAVSWMVGANLGGILWSIWRTLRAFSRDSLEQGTLSYQALGAALFFVGVASVILLNWRQRSYSKRRLKAGGDPESLDHMAF